MTTAERECVFIAYSSGTYPELTSSSITSSSERQDSVQVTPLTHKLAEKNAVRMSNQTVNICVIL